MTSAPAVTLVGTAWEVETRRDDGAFDALAGEWRDLYARCPAATPFQSAGWLAGWWRSKGRPGALRLVLVRHRGRLVAAAPLYRVRRWGLPVLVPVGGGQSDFTDVLMDPVHADRSLGVLAGALRAERGAVALDLPEVRPGAVAHLLAARWPGRVWTAPGSTCLQVPARPIAELLGTLPGRTAGKARAKLRKVDASGVVVTSVDAAGAAEAVGRLLDLHVRQWRGRGLNPEHARDGFRRHLASAVPDMIAHGDAALFEYRVDGAVVASDLALIGHDTVGAYLYGADPALRDRLDVTLMLLRQDLALAASRGVRHFSMLRGTEPYKAKWRPTAEVSSRLILGSSPLAPAYATPAHHRATIAAATRSHRRP
ncbi:GNAT family N-acetyltransferase [Actinomadura flavalba]|uniref:GNAT family N-acetyltransferase n=1 Tax=Actinomadura flavalba TaxID=1120938 RepID=UPI00035E5E3F|nr:GNAT family N-acetyltransferase [Actinomadura flavalba]